MQYNTSSRKREENRSVNNAHKFANKDRYEFYHADKLLYSVDAAEMNRLYTNKLYKNKPLQLLEGVFTIKELVLFQETMMSDEVVIIHLTKTSSKDLHPLPEDWL